MILILTATCGPDELRTATEKAEELGLTPEVHSNEDRRIIILQGAGERVDPRVFTSMPCVERVVPITRGESLIRSGSKPEPTVVKIGDRAIGGGRLEVIAGPCAVESRNQVFAIAREVGKAGVGIFRGGAFKPRTSPYSFQGLGEEGLKILAEVRNEIGLLIVTEALDVTNLELVRRYADIIQIGSRSMHSTPLLKEAGRQEKPVILKRGMAATLEEWMMAAEYILNEGNPNVVLCERGVRTFSDHSRFTLDIGVIPAVKERTHLPVIVDPSHGTGRRSHVCPMALAAIAAGADGLMIEVHTNPDEAISDGAQTLHPESFARMMDDIRQIAPTINKQI